MRKNNNFDKLEVIHIGNRFISQFLEEEYEVDSNYKKNDIIYAIFKKDKNTLKFGLVFNVLILNYIKPMDKTLEPYLVKTLQHIVTKHDCDFKYKNGSELKSRLELSAKFHLKDTTKYGEIIKTIDNLIKYF